MAVTEWTIYTENVDGEMKPFVSFYRPGSSTEVFFQIKRAENGRGLSCWRFFPVNEEGKLPYIFLLTNKVRYKLWPDNLLSNGMIHAFLCDNKVFNR